MIVTELFAKLGLEVDEGSFKIAESLIHGLKGGLTAVGAVLGGMAVGLAAMIKTTADTGDHLDEMSARTGVSTDALQKLGYAAKFSSVGMDELAVAMNYMAKRGSKNVEKDLGKVADHVKALTDKGRGSEAAAYAIEHLGRAGGKLVPMLKEGSAALKAYGEEAEQLGLVMNPEQIKNSAEFNDGVDRLTGAYKGLMQQAVLPLLPLLTEVLTGFLQWFKVNRDLIKQRLDKTIGAVVAVMKVLWKVLGGVTATLDFLITYWKTLAIVMGGIALAALIANAAGVAALIAGYVTLGIAAVSAAVAAAAAWVAASAPVILIGIALAAAGLVLEDFWVALHGGDSVIGSLGAKWTEFLDGFLKEDVKDNPFVAALKDILRFLTDIEGGVDKLMAKFRATSIGKFVTGFVDQASSPAGLFGYDTAQPEALLNPAAKFTGGASPAASAAASPGSSRQVGVSSQVNAPITVNAAPGQSADEIAAAVAKHVTEAKEVDLRATLAAVGE